MTGQQGWGGALGVWIGRWRWDTQCFVQSRVKHSREGKVGERCERPLPAIFATSWESIII